MKANVAPASIPCEITRTVTSQNARTGPAPRLRAACSRDRIEPSKRCPDRSDDERHRYQDVPDYQSPEGPEQPQIHRHIEGQQRQPEHHAGSTMGARNIARIASRPGKSTRISAMEAQVPRTIEIRVTSNASRKLNRKFS